MIGGSSKMYVEEIGLIVTALLERLVLRHSQSLWAQTKQGEGKEKNERSEK